MRTEEAVTPNSGIWITFVVSVAASGKPVFAKPLEGGQGATDFWVRIGNATRQLHGGDMVEYQATHWG